MSEEETTTKKGEEELFGIPISKIGLAAGILGLVGAGIAVYQVATGKGLIPNLAANTAQLQQQQIQQQQQQMQYPQQMAPQSLEQAPPQEQQVAQVPPQPNYAVENDPFQRNGRKVRVPEFESTEGGLDSRFNNISV